MPRGSPVPVMGIWLRREGDYAVVLAEDANGNSVELIREWLDGSFSHNVSEHGIRERFAASIRSRTQKETPDV